MGSVVKRFGYVGSTGQVSWFSSSDTPEVVWWYSYDGLGRRVAKTCVDAATGGVVSRWVFVYSGSQLVAEYVVTPAADTSVDVQTAADACVAGCCGLNAAVASGGTTGGVVAGDAYDAAGDTADGSAGGVCGWSQRQVDAVFYALVADLAGAPQELIDLGDGSVAGWVTQSLYGRRCWRGVDSPLLFIGQYEDQESGWVYNRFRFYDPWSGVYGSQDPLGVAPNPATPYGYVGNPVLWVDPDALKACPNYPELILQMKRTVDEIQLGRLDTAIEGVRKGLNVAGMVDMDGNIYYAMGAIKNLDPADYPGLNIVAPELLAPNAVNNYERVVDHAEQKLLNYAKANNIDVAAIYTYLDPCPAAQRWKKMVVNGLIHGKKTCEKAIKDAGLVSIGDGMYINPLVKLKSAFNL